MRATPGVVLQEETDALEAIRVDALWEAVAFGDHVRVEHPSATKFARHQGVVTKRGSDHTGEYILRLRLDEPDEDGREFVFVREKTVLRVGDAHVRD